MVSIVERSHVLGKSLDQTFTIRKVWQNSGEERRGKMFLDVCDEVAHMPLLQVPTLSEVLHILEEDTAPLETDINQSPPNDGLQSDEDCDEEFDHLSRAQLGSAAHFKVRYGDPALKRKIVLMIKLLILLMNLLLK